jgi:predicted metalloprotease
MRWQGRRESTNVEDRRGISGRHVAFGGGIGGIIIVVILSLIFGKNPLALLENMDSGGAATGQVSPAAQQANDEAAAFAKVVLADTEDVWGKLFAQMNKNYVPPTMVLFTGSVQSACGMSSAATGPFYCPMDEKLYIDLSFFNELQSRFNAPGDFAEAYVIAHEVGHHIQKLLGISQQVQALEERSDEARANALSVRLELQADFLAGVWAHYDDKWNHVLEQGDIQEALQAANAVGDDRLQKESQGYIVPDAFTHGTSEQRMRWFTKGFQTGDISQGDTFSATSL